MRTPTPVFRVTRTQEFLVAAADERAAESRADEEAFMDPGEWAVEPVGDDDGGEDVLR